MSTTAWVTKPAEYRILGYEDANELTNRVEVMLNDGWECVGGVSVARLEADGTVWFHQAMRTSWSHVPVDTGPQ